MEFIGKIDHYANGEQVIFSFRLYNEKASSEESGEVYDYTNLSIPFEIYKKFKNNKVKITIEKA